MVKWMHGLVRVSCICISTPFIILMHTVYKKIKYTASSFHFSIKQTFLLFDTSKREVLYIWVAQPDSTVYWQIFSGKVVLLIKEKNGFTTKV